jgi:hypothetical protein
MPRISERNSRYRTKERLVADVVTILNSDLAWGTQFAVLSDAVWVWSEFDGKLEGCRHWSPGAWRRRASRVMLMHEHVVPKRLIIERLRKLRGRATGTAVKRTFEKWCVGVVILRSEDAQLTKAGLRSKMPDGWKNGSIWARYESIGLKVLRDPNSLRVNGGVRRNGTASG